MITPYTPKTLVKAIEICLASNSIPFIRSSPGIGKTAIVSEIGKRANLYVIPVLLGSYDPTELKGFLFPDKEKERTVAFPLDDMIFEDDIRHGEDDEGNYYIEIDGHRYDGVLLFFDEFTSATLAVQSVTYQTLQKLEIGGKKLSPLTYIVLAGNKNTDRAHVNPISSAAASRVNHLSLTSSFDDWFDMWAKDHIHPYILAFLKADKSNINNFDDILPKLGKFEGYETFACERTWEGLSEKFKCLEDFNELWEKDGKNNKVSLLAKQLFAGEIGATMANQFVAFLDTFKEIPDLDQICSDPLNTVIPDNAAHLCALCGLISLNLPKRDKTDISAGVEYIMRIAKEKPDYFQFFYMLARDLTAANIFATSDPAFMELAKLITQAKGH